jgi:phosphatidylethanolamine/phosphatidyl-N-methylethanolamine N-methyltransferase
MSFAIPRDYSLIAPVYDQVFNKALSDGHKRIGQLLKSKKSIGETKVLEVGVGSGLSLDYIPNTVDFIGVDINPKMLTLAHARAKRFKRKRISLTLMDAEKLSYKSNSFDMVFAASVITAVKDPESAMREIIRVTKKGGHIAVIANLRNKHSFRSKLIKHFDPLTKKFLGFRTDIDSEFFKKFKGIKLIEKEEVNSVFGIPLSSFLHFQKV